MKNLNFHTAYTYLQDNYGISMDQLEFESVGMIAYERIGNRQTDIKGFVGNVVNGELSLPCDVFSIEAVFSNIIDSQKTSSLSRYPFVVNDFVEYWIENWKINKSLLYDYGTYLKYNLVGDVLKFDRDYNNVLVLYRAEYTDEDGFPFINSKEAEAIAAYCAFTDLYKQAIQTRDANTMQLANVIKADWARLCDRARVPEKVTQNGMDQILNTMVSFDRKSYNKSFKSIR